MDLKTNIYQFLLNISIFSLVLAALTYLANRFELVGVGFQTTLYIQLFVFLVTTLVHVFLMRSATAKIRIQKFMFNFMLATTLKIFIYCGAFTVLVLYGSNLIAEQYTNLTLFAVLFSYYLLYSVFEVASILKFLRKIG
ncbi:MAG: hypothetical protein JKY18_02160 [Flavobacteriales bacterium]|nr:hypothetical protein [Flavobacteriales bacterium]